MNKLLNDKFEKLRLTAQTNDVSVASTSQDSVLPDDSPGKRKIFYDLKANEKFCPFRGDEYTVLPCSKRCKLYDPRRNKGYECILWGITQITWDLKQLMTLFTNNKDNNDQKF